MSTTKSICNALVVAVIPTLLSSGAVHAQATEATPTGTEKAAIAAEATSAGSVAKAVFTTAVVDGEPTDFLTEIENTVPEVVFFTVLEGMSGQTITHRWKYNGAVMATAKLDIQRDVDPVWSTNKMKPEWTGQWDVEVVDGRGRIIDRATFAFEAPL